jgi:SAM-dependent methyltransferase
MATDDAETMITRAPMNYTASADGYAEFWSPVIRPLGRRLLEALPWDRASRILDVGTGTGALIPDMLHLAPTARIVGIDPSFGMLARGHEPLPVGRARQPVARVPGSRRGGLHHAAGAGSPLRHRGKTSPFWLGTPDPEG